MIIWFFPAVNFSFFSECSMELGRVHHTSSVSVGLEGECLVQTPAQSRANWGRLLQTMSRWVLKVSKDGWKLDNLLQCSTTLTWDFLVLSLWPLSGYLCPRRDTRAECPAPPPSSFWRSPRWGPYNHSTHTLGIYTHGQYHLSSVLQET